MISKRFFLIYGFFGLVFYTFFLFWTLPISIATLWLNDILSFKNPQGTLWSGQAENLKVHVSGLKEPILLKNIHWTIPRLILLTGRLKVYFSSADPNCRGDAELIGSWHQLHFKQTIFYISADWLSQYFPFLALWEPEGELLIQTNDWKIQQKNNIMQGKALIEWRNASFNFSHIKPLGSYRLRLVANKNKILLNQEPLKGPLILQAKGFYSWKQGLQLEGKAEVATSNADTSELNFLLSMFGKVQSDGKVFFQFTLPPFFV